MKRKDGTKVLTEQRRRGLVDGPRAISLLASAGNNRTPVKASLMLPNETLVVFSYPHS